MLDANNWNHLTAEAITTVVCQKISRNSLEKKKIT